MEQHGSKLLQEKGARLSVRMDYASGVAVLFARTFENECRFKGNSQAIQGRDAVGCLNTESGIEPAANKDALVRIIYKQVLRNEIQGPVTDRHKKNLLRRLKNHFRSGLRYHLTLPLDGLESGLIEKDINEFHKQFPYLKLILFCMDEGESALLVDDGDLDDLILTFFLRVIEEQK